MEEVLFAFLEVIVIQDLSEKALKEGGVIKKLYGLSTGSVVGCICFYLFMFIGLFGVYDENSNDQLKAVTLAFALYFIFVFIGFLIELFTNYKTLKVSSKKHIFFSLLKHLVVWGVFSLLIVLFLYLMSLSV